MGELAKIIIVRTVVDINFEVDLACELHQFNKISMQDGTKNGELQAANDRIRATLGRWIDKLETVVM